MPTLLELQTKRNTIVTQGRAINDLAEKEKRELTPTEIENFNKAMNDSDLVKAEIDKLKEGEARTKRLNDAENELRARPGRQIEHADPDPNAGDKAGIFKFPKRSAHSMREIKLDPAKKMNSAETRTAFRQFIANGSQRDELRNLQMDLDTAGGFLVVPQQYAAELIAIIDNAVYIRQLATVMTLTSATTLGVPTRDVDIADSDWTSELATGNEDSALVFGKRELQPHPLAKRIKISNKLLRAGALDAESIVRDRLAYKFGVTQEKAFLLGSGAQQPLGVMTPTTNGSGISTARDIVTGSATNYTADGLINAKYFLKPGYWANARWGFHRFGIQRIRQLKDTNGQYLWNPSGIGQASLEVGVGDLILGLPYFVSEYMPSTFTTGLYTGVLGDFSFYWIVDALSMQLQRLVELYAVTNQTGYIARAEIDGAPILEEAFVRIINS
ncbi:MAG TPA: phage major capsid protein [Chthoniobacterales bacterium]|nr:phage major capsid protein [Chthoniobacterales bacterium]